MHRKTDAEILKIIEKSISNRTETSNVELKDTRGGLPKGNLWRSISAFSNTKGGIIVFGIAEDETTRNITVCGTDNLAELQEQFVQYINNEMRNGGTFEFRILHLQKKTILAIPVAETPKEQKPCFYEKLGIHKGSCIREGNVNRTLTEEEVKAFIRDPSMYKYDKTQAEKIVVEQLDKKKMEQFLTKRAKRVGRSYKSNEPTPEVMKNLGIIDDFGGTLYPTIAGFLIFATEPPQNINIYSRYEIRCVKYQGNSVASPIIDKLDVIGTLDEQVESCYNFVLKNIKRSAEIVGTKREERYEYPEDAVRELIVNAIIHRDYMITGTYTQINIFSNRIEIMNAGKLPPTIHIRDIRHAQFSRNEIIASILKDLDYLEEYGRGIDLVFERMNNWNLLQPVFKNPSNIFKVIMVNLPRDTLSDRQVKIWEYINTNETSSAKDIEDSFTISRSQVHKDLKALIDNNLVTKTGTAKDTAYKPRY